jgi:hypothetical protein
MGAFDLPTLRAEWRRKWESLEALPDAWTPVFRLLIDRHYARKRLFARFFVTERAARRAGNVLFLKDQRDAKTLKRRFQ